MSTRRRHQPLTQATAPTELPFAPLDDAQAIDLVAVEYGLAVSEAPLRLATERDDTFRVRTSDAEYILKVAHPSEDPQVINLQTAALEHAAANDPELPLQRVIRTRDGLAEPVVSLAGVPRVARLLTYLPGTLLRSSQPNTQQLRACGRVQARLANALRDFDHAVADRHLMFDLRNFADLRNTADQLNDVRIDRVLEWHDEVLMPRAGDLPVQVLHTDFGLDNVVVDSGTAEFVVGILDFGDVVRTWRVADLASGLAAQVSVDGDAWERPAQVLKGYQTVIELERPELDVLRGVVAMRVAQRILMAERLSAALASNTDYLRRNLLFSYQQLDNFTY